MLTLILSLLFCRCAFAQASLFSTQLSLSMGAGKVLKTDKMQTSFNTGVKEMYLLTGAIYINAGLNTTFLNSIKKVSDTSAIPHRATLLTLPVGIGFYMGDDRLYLLCGVDVLSGMYTNTANETPDPRQWVIGYMPEFGFSLKVGGKGRSGFGLGMVGRLMFMQSPMGGEGSAPYLSFAGVGVIVRF